MSGPFPPPAIPVRRANSIALLRLLLAGLVVYGHAWFLGGFGPDPLAHHLFAGATNFAEIGVRGFFVISGYLVLQSERRMPSTRAFLWNRGLRIYPGLWLCLGLTGLVLPAAMWSVGAGGPQNWGAATGYVWHNFILPRTEVGIGQIFSTNPNPGDLNGSLWTLPYEMGCYIAMAAAGWLGLTRSRTLWPWLTGGALLALYLFDLLQPTHALFFKTEGRGLSAWFICGAMLALIPEEILRRRLTGWMAAGAAVIFIAGAQAGIPGIVGPVTLAVIVLWLAWHLPLADLERRVGGDYSYGLYIYAYPVQQLLVVTGLTALGFVPYCAGALLLTLPLAVLSWHLLEKHALRLKAPPVAATT